MIRTAALALILTLGHPVLLIDPAPPARSCWSAATAHGRMPGIAEPACTDIDAPVYELPAPEGGGLPV